MMGKCDATNYFEHDITQLQEYFKRDSIRPQDYDKEILKKEFPLDL